MENEIRKAVIAETEKARLDLISARDKFYAAAKLHRDTHGDFDKTKESIESRKELNKLEKSFDQAYSYYSFVR